jgi:release factor glutamine methyltransferase
LEKALHKLESGLPLPYALGYWEFYKLRFRITPDVLIPRPETELLVERAIEWLKAHPARRFCADIGTGSGCIAIAIAHHLSGSQFIANDISMESLKIARRNAKEHQVRRQISFYQGYLLQALKGRFDLILANLPYIPTPKLETLEVFGREPTRALHGGPTGLTYISELLTSAPNTLKEGGMILLEIDESHGPEAKQLAVQVFPDATVSTHQDLAGQDRMLIIQTGQS